MQASFEDAVPGAITLLISGQVWACSFCSALGPAGSSLTAHCPQAGIHIPSSWGQVRFLKTLLRLKPLNFIRVSQLQIVARRVAE